MYRIRLLGTGVAGAPWISNLYFADDTGGTPQAIADACTAFLDATEARRVTSVTWQVDQEVAQVNPADGQIQGVDIVSTTPSPGTTSAGAMLAKASQINIRMSTGFYFLGRQVQGHLYIGGLASSNSSLDGSLTGSAVTDWDTAAEILFDAAGGIDPVVWSRPRVVLGLPAAGFATPIVAASTQPEFAVLRSRRD